MAEKEGESQADMQRLMISELLVKASHDCEFLTRDLRGLAHYSNQLQDRAMNLLIRRLVEQSCKIGEVIAELQLAE